MSRKKTAGYPTTEVALDRIQITHEYQRERQPEHIASIEEDFREEQYKNPHLAARTDGSLWALDGQQRIEAVRSMGYTHTWAVVLPSKGLEWEAWMFARMNTDAKRVSAPEVHRANVLFGEPVAVRIETVLAQYGLSALPTTDTTKRIRSVAALRECWLTSRSDEAMERGSEVLDWVIEVLSPRLLNMSVGDAYFADLIRALTWMYRHAPEGAMDRDHDHLANFLRSTDSTYLKPLLNGKRSARQAGSGKWYGVNLGEALGMTWVEEFKPKDGE